MSKTATPGGEPSAPVTGETSPAPGAATPASTAPADAGAAAAPAAPLEIAIPEGFKLDEAAMGQFKALAAEAGMKSEHASKLVAWQHGLNQAAAKAHEEAVKTALASTDAGWVSELRADADFGGAKYEATTGEAMKALARFGDKALEADLKEMGLEHHPGLTRLLARVGRSIGEARATDTGGAAGGSSAGGAAATLQQMYPSMFNADGSPKY